ncbi:MAG: peptidase S8/S53 domain-containing protein [Piptocephalis tieghemiana]|nr:MAG: peptidase S8/S53 domain-containing protein [Piptocephalis tieghemiana]
MRPGDFLLAFTLSLLPTLITAQDNSTFLIKLQQGTNLAKYVSDLQVNITKANGSKGNNSILSNVTIGEEYNGVAVYLPTTSLRTKITQDRRVSSMGKNVSGKLSGEAIPCGDNIECQTEAPWGLASLNTGANEALPLDGQRNYTYSKKRMGSGVNVYVIDSGVTPHSTEFGNRLTIGPNFSTDKSNDDQANHGTMMATIIGSRTYGVAKAVHITSVKVFNQYGLSTAATLLQALQWAWKDQATNINGPKGHIINLSAIFDPSPEVEDAVESYYKSVNNIGVNHIGANILVRAAGNMGADACDYSPHRSLSIFPIMAHNQQKEVPSFSNTGCGTMVAPGHRIVTWNNAYAKTSGYGTSQAAAFATGSMATTMSYDDLLQEPDETSNFNYKGTPYQFMSVNNPMDVKSPYNTTANVPFGMLRFYIPLDDAIYTLKGDTELVQGSFLALACLPAKTIKTCAFLQDYIPK